MKKILLFVYFINTSLLWAEEPVKLTLEEAIAIALRENREVLFRQEDLKKAKEKLKEAKAEIFPKLSLESFWTDILDYYEKNVASFSNQFSLKQPIYTGGKISGNIQMSKYGIEINQAMLEKTILETVFNVKKAFFTFLLAKEYAKLNELILNNTKNHLKTVTERYQNGLAPESEIINLKQALAGVEHVFNTSLNQIEEVKTILKNILYLDKDVDIELEGDFVYQPVEVAFDEVYLQALRERPELRIYETEEKMNRLQKEIAKSGLLPNIYASWEYYVNHSNNPVTLSKGWEDHQTLGVVLTWPIFDGFATQAKIRQAELDLKETQLLKEKAIKDIALELKNAYLELNNAISKLKAKDAEISFYEDNLRTFYDKYKNGIASELDLEDAKLSFEISQFNRKEAIYDYLMARAKLERAIGIAK